jgi:hypothetical protein
MEQALRERPKLKRLESAGGGIIGVLAVDRDAADASNYLCSPNEPTVPRLSEPCCLRQNGGLVFRRRSAFRP